MRKTVLGIMLAFAGFAVFQNCGQAFNNSNNASSLTPSTFPTNYTPYGTIPSQGVTHLPLGAKVRAKSSATVSGTANLLTCSHPPCYK